MEQILKDILAELKYQTRLLEALVTDQDERLKTSSKVRRNVSEQMKGFADIVAKGNPELAGVMKGLFGGGEDDG